MRIAFAAFATFAAASALLLFTAPATVLESALQEQNSVRLVGCAGRMIGSGVCQLVVRSHSGWAPVGALSYAWRWDSGAGPGLALAHNGRPAGAVRPSLRGWTASAIEMETWLVHIVALPRGLLDEWQPAGQVSVSIPAFSCDWRHRRCSGKVSLALPNLSSGKAGGATVGDYLIELVADPDGGLVADLSTRSGVMRIEGHVEKAPNGPWRVAGRAAVVESVPEDVRRRLLPDGGGSFALTIPP